jgi:hypothetical protein
MVETCSMHRGEEKGLLGRRHRLKNNIKMHGKRVQIEFILIGTGSRLWLLIENSLLYTLSSPVLHFIWWTLYY